MRIPIAYRKAAMMAARKEDLGPARDNRQPYRR